EPQVVEPVRRRLAHSVPRRGAEVLHGEGAEAKVIAMRRLVLACAVAACAAPATLRPAMLLEVENASRGTAFRIALPEGAAFSVVSQHSMYDQPVTEEFRLDGQHIVLESVSSPSAAVLEYFGITSAG